MDKIVKIQEDVDEEVISMVGVRGANNDFNQDKDRSYYTCGHWARDMSEALINIGEELQSCSTHGFEINIVLLDFYNCRKGPIKINHGWKVQVATKAIEDL